MRKSNWTKDETKVLVIKVFKAVKNGLPIEVGLEWAAKKLGKKLPHARSHWYNNLNDKYKEKLDFYRRQMYQNRSNGGQWTKQEDFKVIMTIKESIVTGLNIDTLFERLAKELGRTPSAVTTRWYKILSKKESVQKDIDEYTKIINGAA